MCFYETSLFTFLHLYQIPDFNVKMADKLPAGDNQEAPLLDDGTPKSVVPLGDNGTVRLSKDSDPSLVPFTPEFSNSSFCHDQNKVRYF